MNYQIQLTTLTPVHIGSGNVLKKNLEFITKNNQLYILDYNLFPQYLNNKQINLLTSFIENNESILKIFPQNFDIKQISKRFIQTQSPNIDLSDFHEFITTAKGQPYIPGSSIKGYINTPLLLHFLKHNYSAQQIPLTTFPINKKNNKYIFSQDKIFKIEKQQTHLSRFYRPSDAYLPTNSTYADAIYTYALDQNDDWIKRNNLTNLAELIPPNTTTTLTLQLPNTQSPFNQQVTTNIQQYLPPTFQKLFPINIHQLFQLINHHTKQLIQNEINILKTTNNAFSETYENTLTNILNQLHNISKDTAILRIGKFTGYNNLTGHWQQDYLSSEAHNELLKQLKGKSNVSIFPKTRRCTSNGYPLGFIQLKIIS